MISKEKQNKVRQVMAKNGIALVLPTGSVRTMRRATGTFGAGYEVRGLSLDRPNGQPRKRPIMGEWMWACYEEEIARENNYPAAFRPQ